jgi:hypothetical protein
LAVVTAQGRHRPRLARRVHVLLDAGTHEFQIALQPVVAELDALTGGSVLRWYERAQAASVDPGGDANPSDGKPSVSRGVARGTAATSRMLSQWAVISLYVAQDVLLRLAIAGFALPAFVLACLMGAVDGLVRRDKRRWSGGRESSFVYHHAKRYTAWALTGGFGLYLSWPFGGFNPAYMVLIFTVLVAATLSTTVGAFKKYV